DVDTDKLEVRVVDGPNKCSGRVEVLHKDVWGTVCDDGWDLREAKVVCRQLGCGTALSAPRESKYGEGKGKIWLSDLKCTGREASLAECKAKPLGENICNHVEDASVECSEEEIAESGPIRLVGGPNRCAGRVEVLHEDLWGSVCHDSWDMDDAQVVCRQLGCGDAVLAPIGAKFGRGTDTIWLDDVNCNGTEKTIAECQARPWGEHNCYHGEDASAICSDSGITVSTSVRLVDGPSRCSGRVEVLHKDVWGTVCDDAWDMREANIVCKQLGCGRALSAPRKSKYGEGKGKIWLSDLNCTGTEASLMECEAKPLGENICNHVEDASVECSVIWLDDVNCTGTEESIFDCPARPLGEHNCYHGEDADVICAVNKNLEELEEHETSTGPPRP
ncbi:PREDICTED: soluble scavenger receptor cysteine-rich domain-containing protein SSC5D-like, partial [Tinamus guttatus]|uniref:soluble scavenger receptor cysteine-rich domain-containing protein SSC5D-like n=1 Tax=Tinamus guttatus TaxID=94827 RepID=UPI00052E8589